MREDTTTPPGPSTPPPARITLTATFEPGTGRPSVDCDGVLVEQSPYAVGMLVGVLYVAAAAQAKLMIDEVRSAAGDVDAAHFAMGFQAATAAKQEHDGKSVLVV